MNQVEWFRGRLVSYPFKPIETEIPSGSKPGIVGGLTGSTSDETFGTGFDVAPGMARVGWELKIRRRSAPSGPVDFFGQGLESPPASRSEGEEAKRPVPTRASTSPGWFASDVARQIRSQFDTLYRASPAPRVLQSAGVEISVDPWRRSFPTSPPQPVWEGPNSAPATAPDRSPEEIAERPKPKTPRKTRSTTKKENSMPPPPAIQDRSTRIRKAPTPWWSTGITPDLVGKWEPRKRNTYLAGEQEMYRRSPQKGIHTKSPHENRGQESMPPPKSRKAQGERTGPPRGRPKSVEPKVIRTEGKDGSRTAMARASSVPPKVLAWSDDEEDERNKECQKSLVKKRPRRSFGQAVDSARSKRRTARKKPKVTFADEFSDGYEEADSPDTLPVHHSELKGDKCTSEESTETARGGRQGQDVVDGMPWSQEQVFALQKAQLLVDPSAPNFWSKVAKHVPGKTATECFHKSFDEVPTPETKKSKQRRGNIGSPEKRANAAVQSAVPKGKKRPLTGKAAMVAARKYGRGLRYQQKAKDVGYSDDAYAYLEGAECVENTGGNSLFSAEQIEEEKSRVQEDMEHRMRMDGYVEGLLKKKGQKKAGTGNAARSSQGSKAVEVAASSGGGRPVGWVASAVAAALAIGKEDESSQEEADSQESEDDIE